MQSSTFQDTRRRMLRVDAAILLAHACLGVLIGLIPYWFNHRFYLRDDMENQFLPMFLHIGRLLRAGVFPDLTSSSWWGSNILGEFQFALFNPFSLAVDAALPSFGNYGAASGFAACCHYAVLAPGCYFLALRFQIRRRWAFLAALCVTCDNYLSFWGASNWFPLFASFVWFVWAWAFLLRSGWSRREWLLAVLFSFMTVTSGFPHTIIMLGLVGFLTALEHWRTSQRWLHAALPLLALSAAVLLSAIPLLGLAAVGALSTRSNVIYNYDFLTSNLRDVLQISSPLHFGMMFSYGGFQRIRSPIFYVAWFIMPLLPVLKWRAVHGWHDQLLTLGLFAGFILFSMQGPEELGIVRYFFRWLPFLHLALMLAFAFLASQAGFALTRTRVAFALGILLLISLNSLQVTPDRWRVLLVADAAALAGLLAFILTKTQSLRINVLTVVTLGIFVGMHGRIRHNDNFAQAAFPQRQTSQPTGLDAWPSTYSIYLGPKIDDPDPIEASEHRAGFQFLEAGRDMINGYTGTGHRPLASLLCMEWAGQTCPDAGRRLFGREPETGQDYVDLFRINEIIVHKGADLDAVRPFMVSPWHLTFDGVYTQRFERDLPPSAGSLAFTPPGVTAEPTEPATIKNAVLRVANDTDRPAPLVFSRLWWPGYLATLDGAPLPVRATSGIFVTIDLPAGARGELRLRYRGPFGLAGFGATALGLALCLIVVLFARFRPDPEPESCGTS